ncbi:hypothetical protein [Saccharopolyspora thermophila]|uniref:Uncharacterized protein n=1 Tax=Saccharopolyspora thermophila TaxID=89367 RepID=A0ABP3LWC9_9PSEU
MGLARGHRFSVSFEDAFPGGALAVSEVEAALERQSPQDRSRGVPARQRTDAVTGLPVWRLLVSDPVPARPSEASVTVEVLAEEKPELPEPVAGMTVAVREVRFTGLTAEARLGGQGDFRYVTYVYRARGIESASAGRSGSRSSAKAASGEGR